MHTPQTIFKWLIIGLSILLAACSASKVITGNDRIYHSFDMNKAEFDHMAGANRIEILDYLYGSPNGYAAKNPEHYKARGECKQYDGRFVNMPRKDLKIFYIKWLDKVTGKVTSVTLDLPKKLPKDFGENHRFFASFKQGQLYVYVITPERRADNEPPNGPRATDYLKTLTLYQESSSEGN
jgi:hypothetical protein